MRFIEIDAITLLSRLDEILGEGNYTLANLEDDTRLSDDENTYNKVTMDVKPSYSEMVSQLDSIKNAYKEERVNELVGGVDFGSLGEYFYSLGLVYTQYDDYVLEKAWLDDEDFFTLLDVESAKYIAQLDENLKVQYGEDVYAICQATLAFITGVNAFKSLTGEEIDFMQETYSDVDEWLRRRRPSKAYGLLSLIVVDGTIVTEEDKTKLLEFLGRKLQELSAKYS